MDKTKIIKKVLLEQDKPTAEVGNYPNWAGVADIVPSFGGQPITKIEYNKTNEFSDSKDELFTNSCKTFMSKPESKYPSLEACVAAQLAALSAQKEIGGVRGFEWNGKQYSACVKRDDKQQIFSFSGYYASIDEKQNCYAPEWYYTTKINKHKKGDKGGAPGSDKFIQVTGPDYK